MGFDTAWYHYHMPHETYAVLYIIVNDLLDLIP